MISYKSTPWNETGTFTRVMGKHSYTPTADFRSTEADALDGANCRVLIAGNELYVVSTWLIQSQR